MSHFGQTSLNFAQLAMVNNKDEYMYLALTITFKPQFSVSDKYEMIKNLVAVFKRCEDWYYSIEYHKHKRGPNVGLNNSLAPHVHATLKMRDNSFRMNRVKKIDADLKQYGGTHWQTLHTGEDLVLWDQYIVKDCSDNDVQYHPFQHFHRREDNLKKTIAAILHEEIEQVIDERIGEQFARDIEILQ